MCVGTTRRSEVFLEASKFPVDLELQASALNLLVLAQSKAFEAVISELEASLCVTSPRGQADQAWDLRRNELLATSM